MRRNNKNHIQVSKPKPVYRWWWKADSLMRTKQKLWLRRVGSKLYDTSGNYYDLTGFFVKMCQTEKEADLFIQEDSIRKTAIK